jgi:hypothetical protein
MKKLISVNEATIVAALTALFGLVVLSLVPPSMAQQQGEQQMTTNTTTATPSPNATTTVSLQDLTNNQTVTEQIEPITITQQWSPRIFISPSTAAILHSACSEGQVVVGGGFQASSPEVVMLFSGPSLTVNAYAVQAYNGDDSASFIQVYAICVGGTGETPAQVLEAQEGSPQ